MYHLLFDIVVGIGIGFAVFAAVTLLVAAMLLAPWCVRLRWTLASQVPEPTFGVAFLPRHLLREVTIVDVTSEAGVVEVVIDDALGRTRRRSLATVSVGSGMVAQLKAWCASGEPLLLLVEEPSGDAQLSGPDASVTGFCDVTQPV